jgi:hypothetical protein
MPAELVNGLRSRDLDDVIPCRREVMRCWRWVGTLRLCSAELPVLLRAEEAAFFLPPLPGRAGRVVLTVHATWQGPGAVRLFDGGEPSADDGSMTAAPSLAGAGAGESRPLPHKLPGHRDPLLTNAWLALSQPVPASVRDGGSCQ